MASDTAHPTIGQLVWIGLIPEKGADLVAVDRVVAHRRTGLDGDYHTAAGGKDKRQVTLIQAEHLPLVARFAGVEQVVPAQTRRNLVIAGLNLLTLMNRRFSVGGVVLEGTGPCEPCSRMERTIGPGGFDAMQGCGGITARVITGGELAVGDPVVANPTR